MNKTSVESSSYHYSPKLVSIAQLAEHLTFNQDVLSSIPSGHINKGRTLLSSNT